MSKVGPDKRLNYYQMTGDEVVAELRSHRYGLTNPEAARRYAEHGGNFLPADPPQSPLIDLLTQSRNWLVGLLLLGAALAWWSHASGLAIGFLIVTGLLVVVSAWRERHTGALLHNSEQLLPAKVLIRRNNLDQTIETHRLVIGDVVVLQAGDKVPADLRLLEASNLHADDTELLGGTGPVHKYAHAISATLPVNHRHNLVLAGSTITSGTGIGIVIAVGVHTELGRTLSLAQAATNKSSLFQIKLLQQRRWLWPVAGSLLIAIALVGWRAELSSSVTLAVVAAICAALVPVGLVIAASHMFATVKHQSRRSLDFQSPSAADRFGTVDALLIDEYPFLLASEPVAQTLYIGKRTFTASGSGYNPKGGVLLSSRGKPLSQKLLGELDLFFEAAILTNHAQLLPPDAEHADWHATGRPDDAALVAVAGKAGHISQEVRATHQLLRQFPYDQHRQRSSVVAEYNHRHLVLVQGAASGVLDQAERVWDSGHTRKLSAADRKRLQAVIDDQSTQGHHCVALAYRQLPKATDTAELTPEDTEQNLTLLGLVAIAKPVSQSAVTAIAAFKQAGVAVSLMSTQPASVAQAIARQIELVSVDAPAVVIGSHELAGLADNQLHDLLLAGGVVWHHLSADDRLRLINIAEESGHPIAISGHSLDDVPGLKHATVGFTAHTSQSVVRDEANLVLITDNLSALSRGINRSRALSHNLGTAARTTITSQATQLILVVLGFVLLISQHIPLMLSAAAILLLNIVFQALPLAALGHDTQRSRTTRPRSIALGSTLFLATVAAGLICANYLFFFVRAQLSPHYIDGASTLHHQAASVVLASLVLCHWITLFFTRAQHAKLLTSRWLWQNPRLFWAYLASFVLLLLAIYLPGLQNLFALEPLTFSDWLTVVLVGLLYAAVCGLSRREDKHGRHAIIALHHEVHGKDAGAKV